MHHNSSCGGMASLVAAVSDLVAVGNASSSMAISDSSAPGVTLVDEADVEEELLTGLGAFGALFFSNRKT